MRYAFYFYIEVGGGGIQCAKHAVQGRAGPIYAIWGVGVRWGSRRLKSDMSGSYPINLCYDSVVDAITHDIT